MSTMAYACGCFGGITYWLRDKLGFVLLLPEITNIQEGLSQYHPLVLLPIISCNVALFLCFSVGDLQS